MRLFLEPCTGQQCTQYSILCVSSGNLGNLIKNYRKLEYVESVRPARCDTITLPTCRWYSFIHYCWSRKASTQSPHTISQALTIVLGAIAGAAAQAYLVSGLSGTCNSATLLPDHLWIARSIWHWHFLPRMLDNLDKAQQSKPSPRGLEQLNDSGASANHSAGHREATNGCSFVELTDWLANWLTDRLTK